MAQQGVPSHDALRSRHAPSASWAMPLTTRSGWQTRAPLPSVVKPSDAPGGPGMIGPGRLTWCNRNWTSAAKHGLPRRHFALTQEPKLRDTAVGAPHRLIRRSSLSSQAGASSSTTWLTTVM
jgi:hypothetical protein